MSADCMNSNLESYILHQQTSCPPIPTNPATYECLCRLTGFTSWYLSTLCITCGGKNLQSPLSNLTALCPAVTASITAAYPDSCSQYVKLGSSLSATTRTSSSSLSTTAPSTSSPSSSSTTDQTAIILSMQTPSPSPSTSKLSTDTASPLQGTNLLQVSSPNSTSLSGSPTSSPPNATYASSPTPISLMPVADSSSNSSNSSNSGMSTGAKAGIGVGAAAAAIGVGFVFMALLTVLRRRNSRVKGPGYGRHDAGHTGRGAGGGASDTSTTLAEIYQDDDSQYYRGFRGSDRYGNSGLGIAGIGGRQREKLGLVPSGRIREVRVGEDVEHRGSKFATPLHAERVRQIHDGDDRTSIYAEHEHFVAPQESDGIWHSAVEEQGGRTRHSITRDSNAGRQLADLRLSTAQESQREHARTRNPTTQESNRGQAEVGTRHSTAQEINYDAAMRPKSRIYSVVNSPVLDLGQGDLSREELERLEEEERRIDEAIRESENRTRMITDREHWANILK